MNRLKAAIFVASTILFTACGAGGGGGGGSAGPAAVSVSCFPAKIDAGDTMAVTVHISDVAEEGIMLKIRTPLGLDYVNDTGFLLTNVSNINLDPDFYEADSSYNYLVYFLPRKFFGDDNYGELSVTYLGTGLIKEGAIDVDPDLDNPAIDHSRQFSATAPNFSSVDSQIVIVNN